MGIKDAAKRLAAGASVALATSGLSNCDHGGAVDPAPPPLQCSLASEGQTLSATARRSADTVTVTVTALKPTANVYASSWQVDSISDVVGATLGRVVLPNGGKVAPITDTLKLALVLPAGGTQAAFTVHARLFGYNSQNPCVLWRRFSVDVTTVGVKVHEAAPALPLEARDSARIVLGERRGRVVELAARTTFAGPRTLAWSVSGGELDAATGSPVRWTLPAEPGIYAAELVMDYGVAGLALDQLVLEVG